MMRKTEYLCVFLTGGIVYNLIELAWRGYTHWSMTIAGGLCLVLIHVINRKMSGRSFLLKYLSCCLVITAVEFAVGLVVNVALGLDVWDYSSRPGNIMGQICPFFTLMWLLLSPPACFVSDMTRRFFDFLVKRELKNGKTVQT